MQCRFLDDAIDDDRAIKPLEMVCEATADVTWYRLAGTEWTDHNAPARIGEAVAWYDAYCIHLNFEEFALDPTNPRDTRIQKQLDELGQRYVERVARLTRRKPAVEQLLYDVQSTLLAIYQQLARKVGRNRMIVIFLDEWYVLVGVSDIPTHWRESRISANDGERLLIGIDRYDTGSPHILTHELLHGLRKASRRHNNRTAFNAFVAANKVGNLAGREWQSHYSGFNQDDAMSFTDRDRAFQEFRRDAAAVLTVREYLTVLHAGYVKAALGCTCDERGDRDK